MWYGIVRVVSALMFLGGVFLMVTTLGSPAGPAGGVIAITGSLILLVLCDIAECLWNIRRDLRGDHPQTPPQPTPGGCNRP